MSLPANIDFIALLAEKCRHTGTSWLQRLSHRTEADAGNYLSLLLTRHNRFYAALTKEEVYDRLNELVYWLSAEGSAILAVAMYKELKNVSLAEAYHKQKEIMLLFGNSKLSSPDLLQQMKTEAAGPNINTVLNKVANETATAPEKVKKYILPLMLLAAASGIFASLAVTAQRAQKPHGSFYALLAVFSVMAFVMLLIFKLYNNYIRKRQRRGEVIHKG